MRYCGERTLSNATRTETLRRPRGQGPLRPRRDDTPHQTRRHRPIPSTSRSAARPRRAAQRLGPVRVDGRQRGRPRCSAAIGAPAPGSRPGGPPSWSENIVPPTRKRRRSGKQAAATSERGDLASVPSSVATVDEAAQNHRQRQSFRTRRAALHSRPLPGRGGDRRDREQRRPEVEAGVEGEPRTSGDPDREQRCPSSRHPPTAAGPRRGAMQPAPQIPITTANDVA